MYLRSKMDSEGFVRLSEISNWNRIRRLGATPHTVRPDRSRVLTQTQHASHYHTFTQRYDLRLHLISVLHTQILEAVQTCGTLEVVGEDFRGRNEESDIMSYSSILATRIRCAENPLSWVPMQMSPDNRFSGDVSPELFSSEQ